MVVEMVVSSELVYVIEYKDEGGTWKKYPRLVRNSESIEEIIRKKIKGWKEIKIVEKWLIVKKDSNRKVIKVYVSDTPYL